jgi:hypothetical protein
MSKRLFLRNDRRIASLATGLATLIIGNDYESASKPLRKAIQQNVTVAKVLSEFLTMWICQIRSCKSLCDLRFESHIVCPDARSHEYGILKRRRLAWLVHIFSNNHT